MQVLYDVTTCPLTPLVFDFYNTCPTDFAPHVITDLDNPNQEIPLTLVLLQIVSWIDTL